MSLLSIELLIAISIFTFTIVLSYVKPILIKSIQLRLDLIAILLLLIWLYLIGAMDVTATAVIFLLVATTYTMEEAKHKINRLFLVVSVLLFLALGFHLFPGFERITVYESAQVKANSTLYHLRFSADKYLAGLVFFLLLHQHAAVNLNAKLLTKIFLISASNIVLVLGIGLFTGIVEWQGWEQIDWHFIVVFIVWQLIFVCLAEEMFFRGFIQNKLYKFFDETHGVHRYLPVLISGLLFGLVHFGGGWLYAMIAGVAGIGYSLVYHFTRRVEASIMAHAMLNLTHLMFFTYPFSASYINH